MTVDEVRAWQDTAERVCRLVEAAGEERMARPVPATPAWTGRDLLSHMVGLGADVLAGDEPDDHNDRWTQAQVDARRDRSVNELVAEWRGFGYDLVSWMREHGTRPLSDAVIHEQDLRGALGEPGARDTDAFGVVRERMVRRFADRVANLPPLRLEGEAWSWQSGEGPLVVVRASDFDLGRALMSRRTAEQVRSWTVQGDVSAYLPCFAVLGPLPEKPLPE